MPQNYYINGECRIRWQKELAKCQGEATRLGILSPGHRKLLSKLWPGTEISETLAICMYMRDWRQLQEVQQETEDREKE